MVTNSSWWDSGYDHQEPDEDHGEYRGSVYKAHDESGFETLFIVSVEWRRGENGRGSRRRRKEEIKSEWEREENEGGKKGGGRRRGEEMGMNKERTRKKKYKYEFDTLDTPCASYLRDRSE